MSEAYARYRAKVDELRERRRGPAPAEPLEAEADAIAHLEELFGELDEGEQEEASEESWRGWPELYDARAQKWHVIVPSRPDRTLCDIRLRRPGEFKVYGPGATLRVSPRCPRCEVEAVPYEKYSVKVRRLLFDIGGTPDAPRLTGRGIVKMELSCGHLVPSSFVWSVGDACFCSRCEAGELPDVPVT